MSDVQFTFNDKLIKEKDIAFVFSYLIGIFQTFFQSAL